MDLLHPARHGVHWSVVANVMINFRVPDRLGHLLSAQRLPASEELCSVELTKAAHHTRKLILGVQH